MQRWRILIITYPLTQESVKGGKIGEIRGWTFLGRENKREREFWGIRETLNLIQ